MSLDYKYFYKKVVRINKDADKTMVIYTVSDDIVKLNQDIEIMTAVGKITGFSGKYDGGSEVFVNFENITKIVFMGF